MYYTFIYCSGHDLRKDQREVEYEKSQISKLKIVDICMKKGQIKCKNLSRNKYSYL